MFVIVRAKNKYIFFQYKFSLNNIRDYFFKNLDSKNNYLDIFYYLNLPMFKCVCVYLQYIYFIFLSAGLLFVYIDYFA